MAVTVRGMMENDLTRAWHLVPEPWYHAQDAASDYLPEAFTQDGFVHLTHTTEAVLAVGNAMYHADPRPYLALRIDLRRISCPVRYDEPSQQYPHVYGPLDRTAIIDVCDVVRDADGRFLRIG